jgi:protein SCO1/2
MAKRFSVILVVAVSFLIGGYGAYLASISGQTAGTAVQISGKALIGGPFELTAHTGSRVTDKAYRGKLMLVFFGFTHCPDICPTELQNIAQALAMLGSDADRVAPLFISVDPERDTPDKIANYVQSIDKRVTGLTGTREDIAKAAKAYRVYYRKAKTAGNGEDYTIDHSAFTYLLDGDGEYLTHFAFGTAPAKMAGVLKSHLSKNNDRRRLG